MLQRAATNACSWWWASHVRTKQSKWLESSLQEMEEKVVDTLKILEDEGESFAKRAETYYRKRPELISFVEEAFKAYKSLAEKYDHLSREHQSANRTIASCFPERVRYPLDEDEDKEKGSETSSVNDQDNTAMPTSNVPKVPKGDLRSQSMLISGKRPPRRSSNSAKSMATTSVSELSKDAALAEIDKLQKEILAMQTEKEFVRSLYEQSYEKHWEIEDQIEEMQKRVYCLQDTHGVGTIIEDNEARILMASTALKSCKEALAKLQEVQSKSSEEAKAEYERVKQALDKFKTLRDQFVHRHTSQKNPGPDEGDKSPTEGETQDINQLREKIKKQLLGDSNRSLSETEMVEKIDELVDTVVLLETAVSSHNGLVKRLKSETDNLQTNIINLEGDNEMLKDGSDQTNKKLKDLEEELKTVKSLNQTVKNQNNSLQTQITQASCNLEHLSERLLNIKSDEKTESTDVKTTNEDIQEKEKAANTNDDVKNNEDDISETVSNLDTESQDTFTTDLEEYNILKMKLDDVDKKNRDVVYELTLQVREFRNALATKDKQIMMLQQKLLYQESNICDSPYTIATEYKYTPIEGHRHSESDISSLNLESNPASTPFTDLTERTRDIQKSSEKTRKVVSKHYRRLTNLEKRFRTEIDDLLEENLEFWLRFSTSIHQIQKFQNSIQDLQAEIKKIKDHNNNNSNRNSNSKQASLQSEIRPIFRHMRDIKSELTVWLENNSILQEELHERYTSLCEIQDEISRAAMGESEVSGYQAAKFQGEVLHMKQENNKVASELQAGLSLVKRLRVEVDNTLQELDREFGGSPQISFTQSPASGNRIPLRSFLFGDKMKKTKLKKKKKKTRESRIY